jgi:protein phosphatase 1 regulatory subunit 7
LYYLPKLRTLDGQEVNSVDKVKADILFGHDLMNKKAIFHSFLPEEEFIDRRLFVSEQIDPESDSDDEKETMDNLEHARLMKMTNYPASKDVTLSSINDKRTKNENTYDNLDLLNLASGKMHGLTR